MYNKNEKYLSAGITSLNRITFKNKLEFILVLLFSFNFLSCEAPRSNPIDPMNSVNSGLGTLEGTVQTYSIPYTPLKDVSVHWVPGGIIVKTDSAGNFYIRNIEPVNGKLFIEKPGYTPDTITITWANSNKVTKQISLSRAPEIDSVLMYTVVENQESSNPNSYLVIVLNINDIDNIIDSVSVQSPSLNVRKTLRYNFIDNNTYLDTLTLNELKVPDIERATGFDFNFYIRDGEIIARGHNKRVQKNNPMIHAEIDCLMNAGRIGTYKDTVLYSTLMPCYLCAGAVVQFGIPKIIAGESRTFPGAVDFMKSHGVEIIDMDNEDCINMMTDFISKNPKLWYEDIGEL